MPTLLGDPVPTPLVGRPHRLRHTCRMRSAPGFLSAAQRRIAWWSFLVAAAQAPVAARFVDDASWLFSICVAGTVAAAIIADDVTRQQRRPAHARRR